MVFVELMQIVTWEIIARFAVVCKAILVIRSVDATQYLVRFLITILLALLACCLGFERELYSSFLAFAFAFALVFWYKFWPNFLVVFLSAPPRDPIPTVPTNPCVPSPCGPNSQCQAFGDVPSCSCLPNYIGAPPNCRPECVIHSECASNLACIKEKCSDPCPGACGLNAVCSVYNHNPVCTCLEGYEGDALSSCAPRPPPKRKLSIIWNVKVFCSTNRKTNF